MHLYPEVAEAGSLLQLLQQDPALEGEPLQIHYPVESAAWAYVDSSRGHSSVTVGVAERCFILDLHRQGVWYGSGQTEDFGELVKAIGALHLSDHPVRDLKFQVPWFHFDELVEFHEQGPQAFVAATWHVLTGQLIAENPPLAALMEVCMKSPTLRRLLPYLSARRLCFSATTGSPYQDAGPRAEYNEDQGCYQVRCDGGESFSRLSALDCAALLEKLIELGPARHGSATDAR